MKRVLDDTRATLSPLDPARGLMSGGPPDTDALARILASPREPRPRVTRRMMLATATVAVAAVVAAVGFDAIRTDPPTGHAGLPPPLDYLPAPAPIAAADYLRQIADAARRSPRPGSGEYEYVQIGQWNLDGLPGNGGHWSIEQENRETWIRPADNTGRLIIQYAGVDRPSDREFTPGELRPSSPVCVTVDGARRCGPDLPTDPATVRLVFADKQIGRVFGQSSVLGTIAGVAEERVLPPATRAALWLMLAETPGITYGGRVRDRAGRIGEAFSLDVDGGLGPARDTLILEASTGEMLGYERNLLELTRPEYRFIEIPDMEPLEIRTPAVIEYTVFKVSEMRPTTR